MLILIIYATLRKRCHERKGKKEKQNVRRGSEAEIGAQLPCLKYVL